MKYSYQCASSWHVAALAYNVDLSCGALSRIEIMKRAARMRRPVSSSREVHGKGDVSAAVRWHLAEMAVRERLLKRGSAREPNLLCLLRLK